MGQSNLIEIQYATESAFAENASDPGSNTWSTLVSAIECTPNLAQARVDDMAVQSRQNVTRPGYQGPRECSMDVTFNWCGHGTAPTGSLTETFLQDLLSDGLGGGETAGDGLTLTGTPTATSLTVASGGGDFVAGTILRVGAKGDGRAEGQAAVVSSATATTITLLTALPAAPQANDLIYPTMVSYPTENPTTTKRFLYGLNTTDAQYHLMGMQLAGLSVEMPLTSPAEPKISLSYMGAYWARDAVTIPSALTMKGSDWAPCAGGSVFFQTVGTSTWNEIQPSSISLSLDMGLIPQHGPGSSNAQYQTIIGWQRTKCIPTLTLRLPWSTTYDALFTTDGSGQTKKQILVTLNAEAGRAIGFYLPSAYPVGNKPTFVDENGLLYQDWVFRGTEGPTTTNDLTRSAIRFFMG